jgi:hypothetical protein
MKYTLTLHEEAWNCDGAVFTTGAPYVYRVGGMPEGQEAEIRNVGPPDSDNWRIFRIKGDEKSGGAGNYESAKVALAVIAERI